MRAIRNSAKRGSPVPERIFLRVRLNWRGGWARQPAAEAPPIRDLAPQAPRQEAARSDVSAIIARHWFGEFKPDEAPPVADPQIDADLTQLPLKLIGTLAADNRDRSLAVIEEGGEATVYAIGDTIRSGVTLTSVTAREAFISNRGNAEKLELPRADETGGSAQPRARQRSASRGARARSPQPVRQSAVTPTGIAKLGDFIRPQPVFQDGKQRGYRVYPGRNREQFSALGLKPGDLVTQINGSPLDDPARGLEVFRSIASSSSVSVTIERNGQPTDLTLDTSQLNLSGDSDR